MTSRLYAKCGCFYLTYRLTTVGPKFTPLSHWLKSILATYCQLDVANIQLILLVALGTLVLSP